ncbi:sugar phosphate isomerase/epimerase family protein [uncultured Alistipes sp.]|jgi:sugar phosphate isomerases/epimerases|uniref:sugar phosphate isomerase/epimerase family protein n=1 Tax=uncultured Alistipes sp. TaxID=538949 RepID=UPI0025F0D703|nr:sugar phosphate isomerase/epimerase family protein [uncultured Alistipes sp.]
MKKLILLLSAVLLADGIARAEYPVGISIALMGTPSAEKMAQVKAAGIDNIEIVFNYFWRNAPENECYTRAYKVRQMTEEAGLTVWSCHLPFSRQLDISVLDPELREQNVILMERMIRLAAIFRPRRLVLHPSSEPITDEERETRLQNSANSIGRLALAAREIGAVLCIENLPRTCLGRDSGEMMRLIADFEEVMVCFDSNHLLEEEHASFFEAVGNRIGTVHISDYDRKDERHWLPGKGVIDWNDFYRRLRASGYKGVFMYEIGGKVGATPEDIVTIHKEVFPGKMKK